MAAVRALASSDRGSEKNRRDDIEKFLIGLGVSFTYKQDVSTKAFDAERSLRNQARLGEPLDITAVKRYTEALYAGDVFPPVLAQKGKDDSLLILDGNHRLRAHSDAGLPIDVYICEAPTQTLVLITFLANTKHGLPSKVEDRLHHALFLVDNGLTSTEAATRLNVPVADLRKAITKQNNARRADDAGIPRQQWEAIPAVIRSRLSNIATDEGLRAATNLVTVASLNSDEVYKLTTQMNQSRSGKRQAAIVAAMRSDLSDRVAEVAATGQTNRKGFRVSSPRSRLGSAIGLVSGLPPVSTFIADEFPDDVKADLATRVDAAIDRLVEIRNIL